MALRGPARVAHPALLTHLEVMHILCFLPAPPMGRFSPSLHGNQHPKASRLLQQPTCSAAHG